MDLRYSEEYVAFRDEVRAFLEQSWPPEGDAARAEAREELIAFRKKAIDAGYLARGIPRQYGGSEQEADVLRAAIVREEFARARAPFDRAGIIVPTLLAHGSDWQRGKFIRPTVLGEILWCQGYSEPGSGSDLASLQTRAELVGDEWVINGQKIWTSGARVADYIFCLCRTEPDAPKHGGISYLLVDMHQPGIEIQPLKQITGHSGFNQLFFSDARTPADWIVGRRGEGWIVSRTTLLHERAGIANADTVIAQFEALVRLALRSERDGVPAIEHPSLRQRLIELEGYVRSHQYSSYRKLSMAARGQDAGIIGMMNKLIGTNIGHETVKLGLDLIGENGLRGGYTGARQDAPENDEGWVTRYMGALGTSIAGGTSNIQRNVIAERGLGLPRDYHANR